MERIQIALEKARARRAEQQAASGGTQAEQAAPPPQPAIAPVPDQPVPSRPAPAARKTQPESLPKPMEKGPAERPGPDVKARWLALSEFRPDPNLMQRNHVVGFFSGREGGKESGVVDMMRTRILQEMRKNGWRRLAITSPNPSCGKTTVCLNLAFSLSRQTNQRTIVLDLDMRRPGMAKLLGMRRSNSLSRVLEDKAEVADNMVRYGENLAFGTNTGPARNPAELLQSAETAETLAKIEAEYDPTIVLCDMPPMLLSDDMLAFAPHVDCVLLLAAAETTSIDDLDICERELSAHTNVLGVVLNKCRYTDPSYGYGYY
jgi:protein-tyrosine kinase